jgi:hypothetical protein
MKDKSNTAEPQSSQPKSPELLSPSVPVNIAEGLLTKFKIPTELLEGAGVRHASDREVRELLGIHGRIGEDLSGIVFPYRDPRNGHALGHRVRLDATTVDGAKYLSEQGCRYLFFAPFTGGELTDVSVTAVLVESEKAALAIKALVDRHGLNLLLIATGGVWGWKRKNGSELQPDGTHQLARGPSPSLDFVTWTGRETIIVFDSNVAGRDDLQRARQAFARELIKRGANVLIADLPCLDGVNGPDDLIAVAGDKTTLNVIAGGAPFSQLNPASEINSQLEDSEKNNTTHRRDESAATKLIDLATAEAELFHFGENCFATISVSNHLETYLLRSRDFRIWLNKRYFEKTQRAANGQALTSAIQTLEGMALFQGGERPVGIRLQGASDKIYLDLANHAWQVVEISAAGWRIIEASDCPVRFRRPPCMLPLPVPERGGAIGELQQFLNVRDDDDFLLLVGWLVGALHPSGPYPHLILSGEQGSAKTTTARCLRGLIDPNRAPLRSDPKEPRDLMIAANNGWICAFDNLSCLRQWLSDALCRLSTGGGFSTRKLYTDDEETIFDAKRPAILTGIEDLATRGDLLDRALIIDLPRIPEDARKPEAQFLIMYESMRPRVLGSLLDAVKTALANLPTTRLTYLPRMADFVIWMTAAEPALTLKTGSFLRAYTTNQAIANELPLESPVAEAIRALPIPWTGTATELLKILETYSDDRTRNQKLWPKSPRSLSGTLRRLAPNLRGIGIVVEFDERNGGTGRRIISVRELPSPSQSSQGLSHEPKVAPTDEMPSDDCDASDDEIRSSGELASDHSHPSSINSELEDEI